MARRLALLTLLACAAAVRHPPTHSADISDSESLDPFSVWDEYEDSYETTPAPRTRTTTPSAKVILKGKIPKVNVTMKNAKGEEKQVIKTTNINIESHTNFIAKPPQGKPNAVTGLPVYQIGDQFVLMESPEMELVARPSTRRPTTKRPPTSRRPGTSRRPASTTRRPTTRTMRRTTKTTKSPYTKKKATCPPKNSGWLSSFFEENKLKRVPEKPVNSGWFVGRSTFI